jgi:signal transduction histidine kinase/ActR/RegA family two-component response regulator
VLKAPGQPVHHKIEGFSLRSFRQFFGDLPIVRKLYIGLAAVMGALLLYSVVVVNDAVRLSRGAFDASFADIPYDARLIDLQLQVREYLATRADRDARQVDETYTALARDLAEAKTRIRDPERTQRLDEIIRLQKEYGKGFARIRALHARRDELVSGLLNPGGQRIQEAIAELVGLIVAMPGGGRAERLMTAIRTQENLLTARIYVNRFLVNNDVSEIERVRAEFAEVESDLGTVEKTLVRGEEQEAYRRLAAEFAGYRRAFDELAKVIGERNRVRDEVFGRIGLVIKEKAQAITASAAADKQAMQRHLANLARNELIEIVLLAVLAMAAAVFLIGYINRGVAAPIVALNATMRRLAVGDTSVAIPGRDRKDEIGAMADAVDTFKKNLIEIERSREAERQALRAAEKASQAKSEFLSSMSHELRTPMNAVLGFAQLLAMDKTLTAAQKKHVDTIHKSGEYLLKLIDDVLDLSRVEAGRMTLSIEDVSLAEVFLECQALLQPMAGATNMTLTFPPLAGLPFVAADRLRLKQSMVNLVSNGLKYNRPKGEVRIGVETRTGRVRIAVADTGPGIPADRQGELFKPFSRLGAEHSGIEGLGIGLVLTKRIIEAMEGAIGVDSALGHGSTFWIDLKTVAATAADLSRAATSIVDLPKATVLHVEDNLINMALVRHVIAPYPGIRLIEAGSGTMGLDLAFAHRPDLVLLDLHLPGIDGFKVIERLKADARTRYIPVIVISAAAMSDDLRRAERLGVDEYLVKPIRVDKLIRAMARHLLKKIPELKANHSG